jgi:hypothetical protein
MPPWNVSPVLTFLPRYVLDTSPDSFLTDFIPQYAGNLEALAFPDTPLIVKVAKRALYRTN